MVEKTPALQEAFGVETFARSIACDQNGGFIEPINAKGKTQDGWNPHLGMGAFDSEESSVGATPSLWSRRLTVSFMGQTTSPVNLLDASLALHDHAHELEVRSPPIAAGRAP